MPKSRLVTQAVLTVLLFAAACAQAAQVRVTGGWIRWLPGDGPLAGYCEVQNFTAAPLRLVGASGADFSSIQFHRSIETRGMERMIHLHSIAVPAGATVRFKPGGYHLMLWRSRNLKIGQQVRIRLRFSDGHDVTATFRVMAPTG